LEPLRGAKQTSVSAALLVLKRQRSFAEVGGGDGPRGVIMRARNHLTPPKTKLKKFGGWGRNRDQLILFIFFLRSSAGSSLGIGCRLDLRKTKKPAERRVLRKPSVYHHLGLRGNRLGGRATEIPVQFSPKSGNLSSTIPLKASYCHTSRVVGLSDDSALVCDKLPTGVSVERERPMSDDNTKDRHWETTRVQRADVG
jgi:hypothetical protein